MKADWGELLGDEMKKDYYISLMDFLDREYRDQIVYPPRNKLLTAMELTGYNETKVLILGQDPYHGPCQSHGLCFSVENEAAKYPPSLRNIFKELESDIGKPRTRRNLSDWAEQGVLLLNAVLSVQAGAPGSHRGKGWERFTDKIISLLSRRYDPVVFVLWGGDAKKKIPLIDKRHHIVSSAHPSPLSAYGGFFGSKPFSAVNSLLRGMGKTEIRWED